MKKRVLCSLAAILLAGMVIGGIVPQDLAKKAALNFYYQKHNQFEGVIAMDEIEVISAYTQIESGIPFYHVFHFKQGGFVLVSAEDLLHPVIGYSFENVFDIQLESPASNGLMYHYMDMIRYLRERNDPQRQDVAESWKTYLSDDLPPIVIGKDWGSAGPLLTTEWDQGWPYNYFCPETGGGGSGGHTYVGCVATAVQQIAAYYRWPDHGQGSTSYIPEDHPEYGQQSVDFENTWYRWDEMCDQPQTINLAIAEFGYHIAVGYHMEFGPNASYPGIDSWEDDSISYYLKYQEYYPDNQYFRDSVSYEEWITILKDNIDRKLPVCYGGGNMAGTTGHQFVCDGYQDSAYFHFNLGWGGQSNGYYTIDNIQGFNHHQDMETERHPDTLYFTYPLYPSGADTLTYVEGSIEDGSGPIADYLNDHQSSWLIDPQNEMDSVTNIEIVIRRLDIYADGDRLYIYDGNDDSAPLLAEFSGSLETDSTIITSGNQAFILFTTDGTNTANGFYLSYYCDLPVFCSGTTLITEAAGTFDDGSGPFYYQNSKLCIWDIDPGIVCPSLELSFNYFMTEEGDVLSVYDLETMELLAEISGEYTTPPPPVVSSSGKMKLHFATDNCCRNDGWEVTYHMVDIDEKYRPLYSQIRPNPASDRINIAFTLYDRKEVRIELYGISGEKVRTLQKQSMTTGTYDLSFNISSLPSGMYFCKIIADKQVETKKLIVLK